MTPLECGIIIDGIPEGVISRKVGLIWGIPVEESFLALKRAHNIIAIGVERGDESMINPPSDFLLQDGDFLSVIAEQSPNLARGS